MEAGVHKFPSVSDWDCIRVVIERGRVRGRERERRGREREREANERESQGERGE